MTFLKLLSVVRMKLTRSRPCAFKDRETFRKGWERPLSAGTSEVLGSAQWVGKILL